jgi:hypothetical protein
MQKKLPSFEELDFPTLLEPNFYKVDKEYFLGNKPLEKRLSTGYINYDRLKDEKDFYEKAVRFITRTAYDLFSYVTKETHPAVRLDIKGDGAYCSLEDNRIYVGMKMLTYKKIPAQIKVDTIIATLYHEMYHKRFTVTGIKQELGFGRFTEYYGNPSVQTYLKATFIDDTMKSIINIFEDRRIEANGAEDLPGYSFYFEESRKYAYYLHRYKKVMPPYDIYIIDYLMMAILLPELRDIFLSIFNKGLLILQKYRDEEQMTEEEFKLHSDSHAEVSEIFKKIDEYLDKNKDTVYSEFYQDIIKVSKDIYNLIPKKMIDNINSAIQKNEIKGYVKITQLGGGKSFTQEEIEDVSDEVEKEIAEFISDELDKIEKEREDERKNNERKVHIEKIKSADQHNQYYEEYEIIEEARMPTDTVLYHDAKKISKNIVNNLGFLDSRFVRNIENYELTEGELDEDELYSISFNNKHIFEDIEDIPAYSLDFGILLDESGSMSGRIEEAKLAVLSMILGLKDNKHINLFVYGHTANNGRNSKAIQIFKYFNTLQRFTDYRRLFSAKARSNNADGYAIEKMSEIMKESKARDKIMIVVSDGQPSAYGYGGASGEEHVKQVVDRLEREGITVIQVCMAYIENSGRMFKHYVPFSKDGQFFDNLKKILMTKLNQFADSI